MTVSIDEHMLFSFHVTFVVSVGQSVHALFPTHCIIECFNLSFLHQPTDSAVSPRKFRKT